MRGHLGDQVLEGPAVPEEAQVGERAGRQQPAQHVERLRPGGRLPGAIRLSLLEWEPFADGPGQGFDQLAVGLEQAVGGPLVVRMSELRAAMVEVAAVRTRSIEPDVPGRLFERRDADATVLQRFGRQGRHALDRDMSACQLGDRVVAVADQHTLVELLGAADGDHIVGVGRSSRQLMEAGVGLVDELVEEDAAKALLGA